MDGNGRQVENGQMLHRIVALLFALADLAEAASLRSRTVRQLVLWVLYPAEAAARKLVLDACGPVTLPEPSTAFIGDGFNEAIRLAACFRILAFTLASLSAEIFESVSASVQHFVRSLEATIVLALRPSVFEGSAQVWPDTS